MHCWRSPFRKQHLYSPSCFLSNRPVMGRGCVLSGMFSDSSEEVHLVFQPNLTFPKQEKLVDQGSASFDLHSCSSLGIFTTRLPNNPRYFPQLCLQRSQCKATHRCNFKDVRMAGCQHHACQRLALTFAITNMQACNSMCMCATHTCICISTPLLQSWYKPFKYRNISMLNPCFLVASNILHGLGTNNFVVRKSVVSNER